MLVLGFKVRVSVRVRVRVRVAHHGVLAEMDPHEPLEMAQR